MAKEPEMGNGKLQGQELSQLQYLGDQEELASLGISALQR